MPCLSQYVPVQEVLGVRWCSSLELHREGSFLVPFSVFPVPWFFAVFFPLDKDGNQRPLSLLALLGCVAVRLMFQLCSDVNQGGSEEQEGEHEAAKIVTHWSVLPAFLLQEVLVGSSLDLLSFLPCLSRWYSLQNPHTLEGGQSLFQPLPRSSLPMKL